MSEEAKSNLLIVVAILVSVLGIWFSQNLVGAV